MSVDARKLSRVFLAEFLGTLLLVFFGDAAIAQAGYQDSGFVHIALGYGLALMIGILASGGASGGHLNPAVTLAMVFLQKTSPIELPVYWLAQYFGAFTGAALLYGFYLNLFEQVYVDSADVIGIFATYPAPYTTTVTQAFDQILGTTALIVIILSVTDEKNCKVPSGLVPLLIGLGLTAIHLSMGANAGCAINPARDFGPRLLTWIAYGKEVWKLPEDDHFFWIPWLLPHVGSVFGVLVYYGFIAFHQVDESKDEGERQQIAKAQNGA